MKGTKAETARAQATVEFMLSFLAALAFFAIVMEALIAAGRSAASDAGAVAETSRAESFMRTAEAYSCNGIAMAGRTGVSYRIQNGEVRIEYLNKTIVVRGIVDANGTYGEPV